MKDTWDLILEELTRLLADESGARQIVHRHVRSVPARVMGFEAVVKETRLRSAGVDAEIEASVVAWRWGEQLAKISDEAQMWRYVRLNTALLVWMPILALHGETPVLGPPVREPTSVVRWLLRDWWHVAGVQIRAMYEMAEEK